MPNYESKVLYVWLDAPIGYVSATKKHCTDNNLEWTDFWKKDNSKIVRKAAEYLEYHNKILGVTEEKIENEGS